MLAPLEPMPEHRLKDSAAELESWYAGELRPKLVRAVVEGRVDSVQADELHALMSAFLERCLSHPA